MGLPDGREPHSRARADPRRLFPHPGRRPCVRCPTGRYEPLAPPFDNLGDAQRRCEQELLIQHPGAQFRWEPFDEPTTSWQMEAHTPQLGSFVQFGYCVNLVGSDFDYGWQSW